MADGGSAGLFRGWLGWFHARGSSSGLLNGPRPAQRLVVGVDRDAGAQREGDGIAGPAVKGELLPIRLEVQSGVVGVFLQVTDDHPPQAGVKGREE